MSIFQKTERGINSTNFNYPLDVDFSDSLIKQKFGHIKNLNDGDIVIEYKKRSLTDFCDKYDTDIDNIFSMQPLILNGQRDYKTFKMFPNENLSKMKIVFKNEAYPMLVDYEFVTAFDYHGLDKEEIIIDCFKKIYADLNFEEWNKICEKSFELFNWIKDLKKFDYSWLIFENELCDLYDKYDDFCYENISRIVFEKIIESYFSMKDSLVKDLSIVEDGSRKFYWDSSTFLKTVDSVSLFRNIVQIVVKKELFPHIKKMDQEFKELLSL